MIASIVRNWKLFFLLAVLMVSCTPAAPTSQSDATKVPATSIGNATQETTVTEVERTIQLVSFSHDRKTAAYWLGEKDGTYSLIVEDAITHEKEEVASEMVTPSTAAVWSPDDGTIAYATDYKIRFVGIDNPIDSEIVCEDCKIGGWGKQKNGARRVLLFNRAVNGKMQVVSVMAGTTDTHQLTEGIQGHSNIRISNNMEYFITDTMIKGVAGTEVFQYDGKSVLSLPGITEAAWSSIGSRIAYVAPADKRPQVYIMKLVDGSWRSYDTRTVAPTSMTWSPFDTYITFRDGNDKIFWLGTQGGSMCQMILPQGVEPEDVVDVIWETKDVLVFSATVLVGSDDVGVELFPRASTKDCTKVQ